MLVSTCADSYEENEHPCIIEMGHRLIVDTSLDVLRRQPQLLDYVVASLFDVPERRSVEVIIDRPSAR